MKDITIYTKPTCPYCAKAKALLNSKNAKFLEVDISTNPSLKDEMMQKANGRHTVPQIFVGDHHVGGCDDLHALEDAGKLDALLKK